MRVSVVAMLIAFACNRGPAPVPSHPTIRIVATLDQVTVSGKRVVDLDHGQFRDADRKRQFEIAKIIEPLAPACASGASPSIELPAEASFDTLFSLTFSTSLSNCRRVTIVAGGLTIEHAFPVTNDGIALDRQRSAGPLGLRIRVADTTARLSAEGIDDSALELAWPLTYADTLRLRTHLRALIATHRPDASARTAVTRRIEIDAPATARAGDVLRLADTMSRDVDGTALFPERSFRAPNPRPKRLPRPDPAPLGDGPIVRVLVRSEPVDSSVRWDGHELGVTPVMLELRREDLPRELQIERPGYRPCDMSIDGSISEVTCTLSRL